ncbi:MAG: hypothetical protein JSR37_01280 [Verrucomicrobia bacterium]|nr:hypothetical protein [Verrucomicrobiota bacterium]
MQIENPFAKTPYNTYVTRTFLLQGILMITLTGHLGAATLLEQSKRAFSEGKIDSSYTLVEEARRDHSDAATHDQYMLVARAILAKRSDPATWFITAEGKPTERLVKLLSIDNLYDPNDGLKEIVAKTQKAWIQTIQGQNNKERNDLKDSALQEKNRKQVEEIVQELGLFDARPPSLRRYDYGACLGALLDGVRRRLSELIELWNSGTRFDSLIFFTGERYLRKGEGQDDALEKLCNPVNSPLTIKAGWKLPEDARYDTEYDMCKLVWEQTELPEDMRVALKDKVVFVNSPRPAGKERPSTKDCYATWMTEMNPSSGTVLAISHPLLWTYQHITGENILGEKFPLDTCAKAATPEMRQKEQARIVSLIQDTAAKCLYELLQRQNQESAGK